MKIQLISDLHLEFDRDDGKSFIRDMPVEAEVLVIAGDMQPLDGAEIPSILDNFGVLCERFEHVIYVPGNHEYYWCTPQQAYSVLQKLNIEYGENLGILCPGWDCIGDYGFVGATMWFPETPDEHIYRQCLADFKHIRNFVPWVHDTHEEHMSFMRRKITPLDVVVTHHLPHPNSIPSEYRTSSLNRFFYAPDATPLIDELQPRLWLHGHTHTPCDYYVGPTRIVCNPRGYPNEAARWDYKPKIIDLE